MSSRSAERSASQVGPKYRQIARDLAREIREGKYAVGSMLPGEWQLSELFGASRFTIREALRSLSENGMMSRRRGSGTRVEAASPANAFVYRLSSTEETLKYPEVTRRENLFTGLIHTDPELASNIDCPIGKEWYRISGIRRSVAGDMPISRSDIYLLPELSGVVDWGEDGRTPVYELVEWATGVSVAHAQIRTFASAIWGELANLLQVADGTPALSIIRRYRDQDGRNFETTLTVHPKHRFEYSMELQREHGDMTGTEE